MNVGDQAVQCFLSGRNCAESVSWAILSHYGFGEKETDLLSNATAGFGGGMARTGHICGAVSGGMLALGALSVSGFLPQDDPRRFIRGVGKKFISEFAEKFGSCGCKRLTGCDFLTEDGMRKFKEDSIKEQLCTKFVSWAADTMTSLLEKSE